MTYHVQIKSGRKGTATEHARYDARLGKWKKREDLVSFEFDNLPEWAESDPIKFWKMADKHERRNGAVYREAIIALPNVLSSEQNLELSRKLADVVAPNRPRQIAIHEVDAALGGVTNPHMHLMYSDRLLDDIERPPEYFFRRYNPRRPAQGGSRKASGGKTRQEMREELIATRERIAEVQNETLARAGHNIRVDHRSHQARGIDRTPERHLGHARVKQMTAEERKRFTATRSSETKK
ncbi:MobA/MobL family protein [Xanthomonas sp. CFBP 8703]|uniref:MobA/MobL family protein n=1 Tax=Xanthomonas bonasiae TaxID=2810351 RepID=A0ABS3B992_9XANT|nr:MobA/MobL family protein [Xanthomonas bonasiae]MBN6104910.1 MobA/MobL family protein [Xanthomonas bonasiae]